MRRKFYLSVLAMLCVLCGADDRVIVENGKSPYRIVIPGKNQDQYLDRFMVQAADFLRDCVRKSTGVELPVVREDQAADGPALFLGYTKALERQGIAPGSLECWEHRIEEKDGNVYIYGQDVGNLSERYEKNRDARKAPDNYQLYVLGTVKAVIVFLENFSGTRILFPGEYGIFIRPSGSLKVPAGYSYRMKPSIEYGTGRHKDLFYDLAANHFPAPWYGCYGGHSHDKAIPWEQYWKSNPEYFVLLNNKRTGRPKFPQYCLSNPEVQKLIYQEALNHLDKGYKMVQLAQGDSFRECECEECKKLYGVESFGEKLWIMHRKMAEQLLVDRPGKLLCIIAYGPTKTPPQTFKEFPDNVMIELAPYSKVDLWSGYRIKQGFSAYLYNWGWYQPTGFTPKCSFEFLTDQVKGFHRHNVRGVYFCGFGELFGLEGPAYFAWNKMLEDPAADANRLLKDYCETAFGPAAAGMEKFYTLLNKRLSIPTVVDPEDWNNPDLLEGTDPETDFNIRLLMKRYPVKVVEQLEKCLNDALKDVPPAANSQYLAGLIRMEFEYLRLTLAAVREFYKFSKDKSDLNYEAMLKALAERSRYIAALPLENGRLATVDGVSRFGNAPLRQLQEGGRLRGRPGAPFIWNTQWMLDHHVKAVGRTIHTGKAPQYLVPISVKPTSATIQEPAVTIQCRWNGDNFQTDFIFDAVDMKEINGDRIQFYLGRGDELYLVAGHIGKKKASIFKLDTDKKGQTKMPGDCRISLTENTVRMTLPWSAVQSKPEKGESWRFNAGKLGKETDYIWECHTEIRQFRDMGTRFGNIIFE